MAELDVERFHERLKKLHTHFLKYRTLWNDATAVSFHRGPLDEDHPYLKSATLHQFLFGYELTDTIAVLTLEGDLYVLATKKKCEFLQPAVEGSSIKSIQLLQKNKEDGNAENFEKILEALPSTDGDEGKRIVALFSKEKNINTSGLVKEWESKLEDADNVETVDAARGISLFLSVKDEVELDLVKKASVLSNKLMKHGCVARIEDIIDKEESVTHEGLATEIDAMIEDPSKIKLKIPGDDVQSAFFPIVQSGGEYDIRVSAMSTASKMKFDIITVSLGARYKNYCSNIARTFLVDPPSKVNDMYETLLGMQEACLKAMVPGKQLKNVYHAAIAYLQSNDKADLIDHLPKNLGAAIGLDFRDAALTLSAKNTALFKAGMTFTLITGFHDLELSEKDKKSIPNESATKELATYALLVSDMVTVTKNGAEVMTKFSKGLADISYTINNEDDDDEEEEESEDDAPDAPEGDEEFARKVQKQVTGQRKSGRLAEIGEKMEEVQEGAAEREKRQVELMTRRNEERIRELARASARGKKGEQESDKPEELEAYKRSRDYPDNVQPNQVKVDMANQCVILPICGNPVPFHISTIKNVVLPDPDNATYLRINFYTAGMAVGKDAPANTAKLVAKYAPYATFIREMTFRSLDSHNLTQAFRQISELRKRARQAELREQEEADLVEQEKLVRTKNERVPRLSDLTMRPVFAGRKTQGNLEAHTNGLRFISTRSEVVEIMYSNIKYAMFQPCENEIMVLIHFHLKNPIMVGKKRQKDVQFFTEVVDASQTVDNARRSMYDPDEMDDEQRERQLRKRLNQAFRDFCKKVENVAKKNDYSVEFDIPYRELGFTGTPHKEMVTIQPSLNCLVNLTETPFFVADISEVDHVHFERVTYMSKAFDMVLVRKDFTKQPWRIDMIDNSQRDAIQDWLTDMEITYTQGPMNLNWKQIMPTIAIDERFYMDTEEDEVTKKEAGWEFLRMYGAEDAEEGDDEDGDDSEFSEAAGSDDAESESEEESAFDSEEEEESDFDADEELEEQGMDWEDMEREAMVDDRRRGDGGEDRPRSSGGKKRRGSAQQNGGNKRRR